MRSVSRRGSPLVIGWSTAIARDSEARSRFASALPAKAATHDAVLMQSSSSRKPTLGSHSSLRSGQPMLKRALDVGVSVTTIAAGIAIVWAVLVGGGTRSRLWPWGAREVRPPTGYIRGDKIDALPGVDFRASHRTLLVVFRSRCAFCIDSVPYYERLMTARNQRGAKVRVVAVGFQQDAAAREFPAQQGWHPDQVVFVARSAVKVRGTPAVLLVDSNGVVVESWLGRTEPDSYEDIVKTTFEGGYR
jgi:hypothetical protein